MLEVGEHYYLSREIIEPACEDHPAFLMGARGEKVKLIEHDPTRTEYPYLVEGPTNPGKPWRACRDDLMRTKPMACN